MQTSLPPELLALVFETLVDRDEPVWLHAPQRRSLRLVCKLWRAVLDDGDRETLAVAGKGLASKPEALNKAEDGALRLRTLAAYWSLANGV
jgi:hypothetical protein